jgi:hypothetical protein
MLAHAAHHAHERARLEAGRRVAAPWRRRSVESASLTEAAEFATTAAAGYVAAER